MISRRRRRRRRRPRLTKPEVGERRFDAAAPDANSPPLARLIYVSLSSSSSSVASSSTSFLGILLLLLLLHLLLGHHPQEQRQTPDADLSPVHDGALDKIPRWSDLTCTFTLFISITGDDGRFQSCFPAKPNLPPQGNMKKMEIFNGIFHEGGLGVLEYHKGFSFFFA